MIQHPTMRLGRTLAGPSVAPVTVIQRVNSTGSSVFSAIPSDGRLIVHFVGSNNSAGTIATPSGFTAGPAIAQGGDRPLAMFWRVAAAEASATYATSSPGNTRTWSYVLDGVDVSSPIGNTGSWSNDASGSTVDAATSAAAMSAGSLALASAITGSGLGLSITSVSGGFVDQASHSTGTRLHVCRRSLAASSGAVNTTFSFSANSTLRRGLLVEIKAAP